MSHYSSSRPPSRPASPMIAPAPAGPPGPQSATATNSIRPMQVKVLYTFDDENKTNCLARCRNPLNIQTAFVDATTQIGIVELRTCIDAIVSGSPELAPKVGKDYTVYAYDYSEYETPLVGQGMLSRVLGYASTTPVAPAQHSRTMVTGRVCKNVFGLFSEGAKETLEVKLRLVPVPVSVESEYVANMERYRDPSTLASEGFDNEAWSAFLQANPGFGTCTTDSQSAAPITAQTDDVFSPVDVQVDLPRPQQNKDIEKGEGANAKEKPASVPHNHFICYDGPHPAAKSGAPATGSRPQSRATSRPSSRASNRARPALRHTSSCVSRLEGDPSQSMSETEEGPKRKRARTTKADWNGKSSFGLKTDSLRVAASSAASMRGLNLPSTAPTASEIAAGELSARPPTPRPQPAGSHDRRGSLLRSRTSLAHEIMTHNSSDIPSPPTMGLPPHGSTLSTYSSPEKNDLSAGSTPADIPSSPPVMRGVSPAASSPYLPFYPDELDSGFVSGPPDEDFSALDDSGCQTAEDVYGAPPIMETQSAPVSAPTGLSDLEALFSEPIVPESRQRRSSSQKRKLVQIPDSSPKLPPLKLHYTSNEAPTSPVEHMPPSKIHSQTAWPALQPDLRSRSESSNRILSPPNHEDVEPASSKQPYAGNLKKKQLIQERLESSIAAGEMPPFCRNCGEINTPTWRRAYQKVETGCPDKLQLSDNDGGVTAWEALSRGADGNITSYRLIKKSIKSDETGFEEMQLCNPCGVWLSKAKSMRPPNCWIKPTAAENKKKGGKSKSKKKATPENTGEGFTRSFGRSNSQNEPTSQPVAGPSLDGTTEQQPINRSARAVSAEPDDRQSNGARRLDNAAAAALRRAIQSSPPKFSGSRASPVDLVDDDPPIRRTLFPSPRKLGEVKSLDTESAPLTMSLKQLNGACNKRHDIKDKGVSHVGKENLPPLDNADDDVDQLFEDNDVDVSPQTPKSRSSTRNVFRTPTSSCVRKALGTREPLGSSERRRRRAISRTPTRTGLRSSSKAVEAAMTPFSRHLSQLLSDSNDSPVKGGGAKVLDFMSEADGFFPFSDFDTDLPMPSSEGFFSMYDDQNLSSDALWQGDGMMGSASFEGLFGDGHEKVAENGL